MANIFAPHKDPKSQPPKWLHWAILIFAAIAGINAYRAQVSPEPSPLKMENYPEVDDLVSADRWQRIMNPHHDTETTQDTNTDAPDAGAPITTEQPAATEMDAPKEPEEHEPDRQPTTSNQTIPNNGGDGESR